jgi:hypothetical protein
MQDDGNLKKVFEVLLEQYEVEEDVLKNDLMAFVEKLEDSGLVKVEES